jgi:hypothetical protein
LIAAAPTGLTRSRRTTRELLLITVLLLVTSLPTTALAQQLIDGDLLVVLRTPGRVLRVDRVTGAKTVISSGGLLQLPTSVAVTPGALFVPDAFMPSVVEIATPGGAQSQLAAGGNLDNPTGIAFEDPDLLVANLLPASFASQVLRIAIPGGGQAVLSPVPPSSRVGGITVSSGGDIFVTDETAASVSSVDPGTGVLTPISSGGQLVGPIGIAVETSGQLVVADASGLILRIDPGNGNQTLVTSGGNLVRPFGIAVEVGGALIVSDKGMNSLVRVHPVTGAQAVVTTFSSEPWGVAIVPGRPPSLIPALPGPSLGLLGAALALLLFLAIKRHFRLRSPRRYAPIAPG